MRVLIATDAFPPGCGGSGWSTYELAKGLRARGHEITLVRTRTGPVSPAERDGYDGFRPIEYPVTAPDVPYLRNYFKNERLYPRLARYLEALARDRQVDVVHAQHRLTGPPGIEAGRRAGIPAVCTVRDYWPVCYWSDLIYDRSVDTLCPGCSPGMMTRCVRPRGGCALAAVAAPDSVYAGQSRLETPESGGRGRGDRGERRDHPGPPGAEPGAPRDPSRDHPEPDRRERCS